MRSLLTDANGNQIVVRNRRMQVWAALNGGVYDLPKVLKVENEKTEEVETEEPYYVKSPGRPKKER